MIGHVIDSENVLRSATPVRLKQGYGKKTASSNIQKNNTTRERQNKKKGTKGPREEVIG